MTLIFGNFPYPPDMSGGMENSQTSIFLHRLVCGNPVIKSSLSGPLKIKKTCVLIFGCLFGFFWMFFVCFCMIWSYIIIFSPPEHRKHHLNLKWGDSIFWFRPISCTHFATLQHMCSWLGFLRLSQIVYLIGSLGFGCELWTGQSGPVSPKRLTSAFLLAASIAARSSLNDWIMSKNPFSFRTSSRHLLLSHINWPKEAHFETIVSNYKFLAQIIKFGFFHDFIKYFVLC